MCVCLEKKVEVGEPDAHSERRMCVFVYRPPWLNGDKTMVFAAGLLLS